MFTTDITGRGGGKAHALPPVRGTARLAGDGSLTVGTYADGQPARWPLSGPTGRARHALIVAGPAAGATTLLRSVLDGVQAAGAHTHAIDVDGGGLGEHDTTSDPTTARDVLVKHLHVAYARLVAAGDRVEPWPLRVLAIDGLHRLTGDAGFCEALATLVRIGPNAATAVLARTGDLRLAACGGKATRSRLGAYTLVLLRTDSRLDTRGLDVDAAAAPAVFAGTADSAGIGYLPRQRPGIPFRAWLPR